jgi:hypothetical protein
VACPPKFGPDVIRPALFFMLSTDRWSLLKRCTACITISPKQRLIVNKYKNDGAGDEDGGRSIG